MSNCTGNIYNIGMGCCQPVLGPIEQYYTKYQIDRMISGITVSGVTEEQMNDAIDEAKTEIEAEIPTVPTNVSAFNNDAGYLTEHQSLSGYATEQWVENKGYITGVDLSNYATLSDIPDMENYVLKSEMQEAINALQLQISNLVASVSGCCSVVGNIITYTADSKLPEVLHNLDEGLFVEAFSGETGRLTITNHSFDNGVGTIELNGIVTDVSIYAFNGCSGLTNIYLPNTISTIGAYAFKECEDLETIHLPSSLQNISMNIFEKCYSLDAVTIPDGVLSIADDAFSYCSGMTSITIPDSVLTIGERAFFKNSSLTSCTIGSGITSIGGSTFLSCNSLTSMTINSTTPPTLGNNAFSNTNNCPIYVPRESVDTYKSASGWSAYASRIQPIT